MPTGERTDVMRWQHFAIYVVFLAVWAAFAAWQYRGWEHEGRLIDETLHQQSHSVMNAPDPTSGIAECVMTKAPA